MGSWQSRAAGRPLLTSSGPYGALDSTDPEPSPRARPVTPPCALRLPATTTDSVKASLQFLGAAALYLAPRLRALSTPEFNRRGEIQAIEWSLVDPRDGAGVLGQRHTEGGEPGVERVALKRKDVPGSNFFLLSEENYEYSDYNKRCAALFLHHCLKLLFPLAPRAERALALVFAFMAHGMQPPGGNCTSAISYWDHPQAVIRCAKDLDVPNAAVAFLRTFKSPSSAASVAANISAVYYGRHKLREVLLTDPSATTMKELHQVDADLMAIELLFAALETKPLDRRLQARAKAELEAVAEMARVGVLGVVSRDEYSAAARLATQREQSGPPTLRTPRLMSTAPYGAALTSNSFRFAHNGAVFVSPRRLAQVAPSNSQPGRSLVLLGGRARRTPASELRDALKELYGDALEDGTLRLGSPLVQADEPPRPHAAVLAILDAAFFGHTAGGKDDKAVLLWALESGLPVVMVVLAGGDAKSHLPLGFNRECRAVLDGCASASAFCAPPTDESQSIFADLVDEVAGVLGEVECVQRSPNDADALLNVALLVAGVAGCELAEANSLCAAAAVKAGDSPGSLIRTAVAFYRLGRPAQAAALLCDAVVRRPRTKETAVAAIHAAVFSLLAAQHESGALDARMAISSLPAEAVERVIAHLTKAAAMAHSVVLNLHHTEVPELPNELVLAVAQFAAAVSELLGRVLIVQRRMAEAANSLQWAAKMHSEFDLFGQDPGARALHRASLENNAAAAMAQADRAADAEVIALRSLMLLQEAREACAPSHADFKLAITSLEGCLRHTLGDIFVQLGRPHKDPRHEFKCALACFNKVQDDSGQQNTKYKIETMLDLAKVELLAKNSRDAEKWVAQAAAMIEELNLKKDDDLADKANKMQVLLEKHWKEAEMARLVEEALDLIRAMLKSPPSKSCMQPDANEALSRQPDVGVVLRQLGVDSVLSPLSGTA